MIESLTGGGAAESEELADLLKRLAPRWFLMRNAQGGESASLLQPRWAMSFMRGSMTRWEIQEARKHRAPLTTVLSAGPIRSSHA